MWVFRFVRNVFKSWNERVRSLLRTSMLQSANPTCNIHYTSKITSSILGKYNVIFSGVIIHQSKIGSHSYVQRNTAVFNAEIGRFCSVASGVSIGLGVHYMEGVSTHPSFYLKNTPLVKIFSESDEIVTSKQIRIGHDVWIGQNAIILDGVNVGSGAIIAAGAVVNKDVAPYSIVGGIPARLIRYRFPLETCEALLRSEWWNKPEEWLQKHYKQFMNADTFLTSINF